MATAPELNELDKIGGWNEEVDLDVSREESLPLVPESEATEALLVQASRCYDALMLLLKEVNPVEAANLSELHELGGLMSPPIHINPDLTD